MNWKRTLGLDNLSEEYAFARNDSTGYTSAKKIPDTWVPTTCGYCSVGCGIEIGVKDGKAIASRPFAAHPVNRGKLCPKGLSEHACTGLAPHALANGTIASALAAVDFVRIVGTGGYVVTGEALTGVVVPFGPMALTA